MIGKLSGKVDACYNDHLIIDVNGVGYLIFCSAKTLQKSLLGEFCHLFIETHVRAECIQLYGFLSLIEKTFFNLLKSVSGVGPKMSINILSQLSPEEIELAISRRDKETFHSIVGVGNKLAERIIIELKDKVFNMNTDSVANLSTFQQSNIVSDAISALTNLGINKANAQNIIHGIFCQNPGISIDELIKLALNKKHII